MQDHSLQRPCIVLSKDGQPEDIVQDNSVPSLRLRSSPKSELLDLHSVGRFEESALAIPLSYDTIDSRCARAGIVQALHVAIECPASTGNAGEAHSGAWRPSNCNVVTLESQDPLVQLAQVRTSLQDQVKTPSLLHVLVCM